MIKYISLFFSFILLFTSLYAQVEINGSIDFEVAKGGEHSTWISNEIAQEFRHSHLAISQFNLFTFATITENFSVNARIQFDTWGTGRLNNPRITLAMLSWEKESSPVLINVGRFINPFGLYPKRILGADNLFAHAPLAYGYFINISDKRGFWPKAGDSGIYGPDDVGLTTIYFGGYNTGVLLSWIIVPELLNIDVALANAALAAQADYTNLANAAGIIRLGLQPVIYWQQGLSLSYGSFIQKDGVNSNYAKLEKYKQLIAGTDFIFAHSYFELSGEIIYSSWKVPAFFNGAYIEQSPGVLKEFNLENYSGYVDFKIEPPFFTGSYLAFRYDLLRFIEAKDLKSQQLNPWDSDITRYSFAFGYKFARSILLKLVYTDQNTANITSDPKDYSYRGILTISF